LHYENTVFGYSRRRGLLYGNATGYFPESTWAYLKGIPFDIVNLDCTMGAPEDIPSHMGVEGCTKARQRLLKIECAGRDTQFVLTRLSHNGGLCHEDLIKKAGKDFIVAYDGMTLQC